MRKSKIGFSVLVAVALALAPALPAAAAPVTTEQPISHVTAAVPGSPKMASPILGVPSHTLMDELDGFCDFNPSLGELCLSTAYPWTEGSIADFVFGDCNLNDNVFLSPGPGQGQVVGGNIRAAINWDTNYAAQLFTQPNCQGDYSLLPPGNSIFNPTNDLLPWRSFTWVCWGVC
jgi:hypothetical protein